MTSPQPPPDASLLRIEIASSPDVIDVRLFGEMDLSTRGELPAAVSATPRNGARLVHLDMTGLSFCDASGISDLVATRDQMGAEQRTVTAFHATPNLLKLFTFVGLGSLLA